MPSDIRFPLTIYYDASCPLCRTEMETLKASDHEHQLILVDCSNSALNMSASCPVTREALMSRIHAQDVTGKWISGVDVFAAAYSSTGFTRLGKFWGSRSLRPILNVMYPLVADNRHWLSKTPLPSFLNFLLRQFSSKKTSDSP